MLENYPIISIVAIGLVSGILITLVYFLWKTIITSDSYQQGVNLYQQQDYSGAEAAFRKVIAMNSTNDMVRLLLGDSLLQQNKLEEASQIFQDVIANSPKNVDAYLRLAKVLMQQEKREAAISTLQQARDLFQTQRNPEKAAQIEQILQKMNSQSG
ncbi:MAG: tetratricopeptide repeat protein [Nostocaceae cyanobacterium]|nr:tetratricopeptide repeat protein [Nostocaceae cyanobacterium]